MAPGAGRRHCGRSLLCLAVALAVLRPSAGHRDANDQREPEDSLTRDGVTGAVNVHAARGGLPRSYPVRGGEDFGGDASSGPSDGGDRLGTESPGTNPNLRKATIDDGKSSVSPGDSGAAGSLGATDGSLAGEVDMAALTERACEEEAALRGELTRVLKAAQAATGAGYDDLAEVIEEKQATTGISFRYPPLAVRLYDYCASHDCDAVFEAGMGAEAARRVGGACAVDSECLGEGAPLVCCIDVFRNTFDGVEGGMCGLPSKCPVSQGSVKYWYRSGLDGEGLVGIKEMVMSGGGGKKADGVDWRGPLEEYQCDSKAVRSQGACGACSGMSVSTAYSQRLCLFSRNHDANVIASVNDISDLFHILHRKKATEGGSYVEFRQEQVAFLQAQLRRINGPEAESGGTLEAAMEALHNRERDRLSTLRSTWMWRTGSGGMRMAWMCTLMGDGPDAVPDWAAVIPENCHPYRCKRLSEPIMKAIAQAFVTPRTALNKDVYSKIKEGHEGKNGHWGVLSKYFESARVRRKRAVEALSKMSFMRPTILSTDAIERCDSREIPLRTDTTSRTGRTFYVTEWKPTKRWGDIGAFDSQVNAPYAEYAAIRRFQPMRHLAQSMRMVEEELRQNGPFAIGMNVDWLNGLPTIETTNDGVTIKIRVPNTILRDDATHAMVLMGWVEASPLSYWVIQNSWGSDTENQGYFYVQRGYNKECFSPSPESRPELCGLDLFHALFHAVQIGEAHLSGPALSARTLGDWNERSARCRKLRPEGCAHGHFKDDCSCRCNSPYKHGAEGSCNKCAMTCEHGELDERSCACRCGRSGFWGENCNETLKMFGVCLRGPVVDGKALYRVSVSLVGSNAAWPASPKVYAYQLEDYTVVNYENIDIEVGDSWAAERGGYTGTLDLQPAAPGSTMDFVYSPVAINEFGETIELSVQSPPSLELAADAPMCDDHST